MSANIQIFFGERRHKWESKLLALSLRDLICRLRMGVIGTCGSGRIGIKVLAVHYAKNWFYDG